MRTDPWALLEAYAPSLAAGGRINHRARGCHRGHERGSRCPKLACRGLSNLPILMRTITVEHADYQCTMRVEGGDDDDGFWRQGLGVSSKIPRPTPREEMPSRGLRARMSWYGLSGGLRPGISCEADPPPRAEELEAYAPSCSWVPPVRTLPAAGGATPRAARASQTEKHAPLPRGSVKLKTRAASCNQL